MAMSRVNRPATAGQGEPAPGDRPVAQRPGAPRMLGHGAIEAMATGDKRAVVVVEGGVESHHADAFMCPAGAPLASLLWLKWPAS